MIRQRTVSIAYEAWPQVDRQAWERAFAPAESLFNDIGGAGERLSPAAITHIREAYSVWLSYLQRSGQFDPVVSPGERVTKSRLNGWIADLRSRGNAATTLHGRLTALHMAMLLMEPGRDMTFIVRPRGRSLRKALRPAPRKTTVEDPRDLLARAQALFEDGRAGKGYAQGRIAIRDAALLGLLTAHGPRIRSVGLMELGTHIRRTEDGYQLDFGERDTKTGLPLAYDMNPALVPVFDHYLATTRPSLSGRSHSPKLWIGMRGEPLLGRDLGKIVVRRTKSWLGRARGPHWFRKCIRAFASEVAPEAALDAATMLGHSPKTSIDNYAMATAAQAVARHGANLERLREDTWSLAASAFGWRDLAPSKRTGRGRACKGIIRGKEKDV